VDAGIGMTTAREVLLRLMWDPRLRIEDYEVLIRHRGAPGDVKVIPGSSIRRVGRGFFVYDEGGVEVHIPYHRVLEVRGRGGEVVFRRG